MLFHPSLLNTLPWFSAVPEIESPSLGCSRRPATQGPFGLLSGLLSGLCATCASVCSPPAPSALRPLLPQGLCTGCFLCLVPSSPSQHCLALSLLLSRLHVPAPSAPSRPILSLASRLDAKHCWSRRSAVWFAFAHAAECLAQKRGRKWLLDEQTGGWAVPREGEGVPLSLARRPR